MSTRTGAAPFSSKVRTTSRNSPHLYYLVLLFSASPQARICGWTPPSPGKETQSYYPKNATRRAMRPRPGLQSSHTLISAKPRDPAIGPQNSGPACYPDLRPGDPSPDPASPFPARTPHSNPGPVSRSPARPRPQPVLPCPRPGLVTVVPRRPYLGVHAGGRHAS